MPKKVPRDPNAPKPAKSAYLLYQNAMRDTFKTMNPGMTFGQLSKFTSAMYADLTEEEKAVWVARADVDKARYLEELSHYEAPPGYSPRGRALMQYSHTGRSKPERDPNAPKRARTAYLLYQNAMREQFRSENPGMTFGQLSKYTSAMYKNLTPDEKQIWDERAEQDKSRYLSEMAMYIPPPGHDKQGNLIEDHNSMGKKSRRAKDPNAPKRARGSYVFFTFDERPRLMQEYPDLKFVEMGNILGERWRAMSREERRKYEDLAAEDKLRFNREMEAYNASLQHAASVSPMAPTMAAPHEMYMTGMDQMQYDPTAYQHHTYDHSAYQYH